MTGNSCWIVPPGKADRLQLVDEIVVIVAFDVGIESIEAELLEQMRLPQIADVVIDPAALAPARDGPDVAGQHQQKAEAANGFEKFHPAHIGPAIA